ncbi:MAG: hypothetical protein U0487_02200 [Patescibacteria group bacterium]
MPGDDVEVVNGLFVCGPCYRGEKCASAKKTETLSVVEQTTMVFLESRGIKTDPTVVRRQLLKSKLDLDQKRMEAAAVAEAKRLAKEAALAEKEKQKASEKASKLAEKRALSEARRRKDEERLRAAEDVKRGQTLERLQTAITKLTAKLVKDIERQESAEAKAIRKQELSEHREVLRLERLANEKLRSDQIKDLALRYPRVDINLIANAHVEPRKRKLIRLSPEQKLNPFSKKGMKRVDDWQCSRCDKDFTKDQRPATRDEKGPVCPTCYSKQKGYKLAKSKDDCAYCGRFADVQARTEKGACCQGCYRKHIAPKHQCSFCPEVAFIVKNFADGNKQCSKCNDRERRLAKKQRNGDALAAE